MPHLFLDGRSIFYDRGGVRGAPVLLLSGSLGTTLEMWDPQVEGLQNHYEIIRYDMRGHGRSSTPAGPYRLKDLGRDVIALIEALKITGVAFCGLSIGGAIGQWLAIHAGGLFRAFILANTAARIGTPEMWAERISTVEALGMGVITKSVVDRWFTGSFQRESRLTVERMKRMLGSCDPEGYISACLALREMDLRASIYRIRTQTCILAGEYDLVTTVADAEFLQQNIAGSSLVRLSAAHISNIEAPASFNAAVLQFLKEQNSHG